MANSKSNQKGENVASTLLTPCRPVGLRRKRPSPKDTNSPLLKTSQTETTLVSPSTPISTGLSRAREIIEQQENDCVINSSVDCEPENQGKEGRKNLKRKSCVLHAGSSLRKRPIPRNIIKSCSPQVNCSVSKTDLGNSISMSEESVDNGKTSAFTESSIDILDHSGEGVSHTFPVQSSPNVEKPVIPTEISTEDVERLRERIAKKEKTLKELKLAALYKKKHDFKQVEEEIDCWLVGCKEALYDLQSELKRRDQVYSLTKLLGTLGVPPSLIGIDEED